MSTEELISTYPMKTINYSGYFLIFLAIGLGVCAFFLLKTKYRLKTTMAFTILVMALVLFIIGGAIGLSNHSQHQLDINDWKAKTYQLYLEEQEKIEEEVTNYNVNEDGSITVIAVAADQSIVPYQKLKRFVTSAQGRNYISYVKVSGLASIGIPDGKELITLHLKERS